MKSCSSIKRAWTLATTVKDKFYRTLATDQRGGFIHKKWLNVSKHRGLCGILTCLIPSPFPSSTIALKKNGTTFTVKTSILAAPGRGRRGLELPRKPFSGNCHYLTCQAVPWKTLFSELVFIWSDSEQLFPQEHLAKTIDSSYLTSQLPKVV